MGFWGNVLRVKFIFKKDNVAMVEFATAEEAQSCLKFFKVCIFACVPVRLLCVLCACVVLCVCVCVCVCVCHVAGKWLRRAAGRSAITRRQP
jgi:hypothetical protein